MAGPGIRYHHFARELAGAHDVTLVVPNADAEIDADVKVVAAPALGRRSLVDLCKRADAVVAQQLDIPVMTALGRGDTRTIYDLYVPAVTEHLPLHAGQEAPSARRRIAYRAQTLAQLTAVATGTAFVCASERQRDLWLGMLSALGRLDVEAYRADPSLRRAIEVVPFGLDPEPPPVERKVLKGVWPGIRESDRVLLWGGGIWNWFDPLTVIRAVDRLSRERDDVKLFFLGVRHPSGVEAMTMADRAHALSDSLGLTTDTSSSTTGGCPTRRESPTSRRPTSASRRTSTRSRRGSLSGRASSTTSRPGFPR